jgi:hypothetical protein
MPTVTGLERQGDEHLHARRIAEALRCYDRALRLGGSPFPALENRWAALMLLGHLERAWQETDRSERLRHKEPASRNEQLPRHFRRVWDGGPLAGRRVCVRCYHGLGDTLQFARYLPLLAEVADCVEVECQPKLRELLSLSFPAIEFQGAADERHREERQRQAVQIELMELAYAFRTTLETIPRQVPYLHVPTGLVERQRNQLPFAGVQDDPLQVGLVWNCGPWNQNRGIPVERFQALMENPALHFVSLEQHAGAAGHASGPSYRRGWSETILNTAATILCLDLVISVDTMVAHLAGALGRPVWTLLPFESDWRWMSERQDSPWYPTMQLIRQAAAGDWHSALAQVNVRLRQMIGARRWRRRAA